MLLLLVGIRCLHSTQSLHLALAFSMGLRIKRFIVSATEMASLRFYANSNRELRLFSII